jgi:hypothetical protein
MGAGELLASWNDTATRAAITDFVARVTGDGPDHLPPIPGRARMTRAAVADLPGGRGNHATAGATA